MYFAYVIFFIQNDYPIIFVWSSNNYIVSPDNCLRGRYPSLVKLLLLLRLLSVQNEESANCLKGFEKNDGLLFTLLL